MIEVIKDKIQLSDEISKHLKLTKRGEMFWGLCPFHHEKTPSFIVNNTKKFYYCFSCGASGDIFNFYKNYLHKEFPDALVELAEICGVKITKNVKHNHSEVIMEVLNEALVYYRQNLKENTVVMNYLKARGISEDSIELFQIGFADESKVINHLVSKGYNMDSIKKAGLNSYGGLDRFRNRIIFPIFTKSMSLIGFSGRVLDDSQPKYLNSPETDIFQKNLHLFNENNLVPKEPIILMEGYMDVISMHQMGFPNVLASMGTSLSSGQVLSMLKNSHNIYLMLDGDQSGQSAMERNILVFMKVLTVDHKLLMVTLDPNKDPDNLAQKKGKNYLENLINKAEDVFLWQWKILSKNTKKNPKSLGKLFEKIDEFLVEIANKNLRRVAKMFFEEKINLLKSQVKNLEKPLRSTDSEDIVVLIMLKIPDIIEKKFEEIADYTFENKIYEKIRQEIVDKVMFNEESSEEIVKFIISKYGNNLINLFNMETFSYIIQNRGFALRYFEDTLMLLKKTRATSVE